MKENKKEINSFIKERIKQNISKSQISNELLSKYPVTEFEKILKDFPEPALRDKYKFWNKFLIWCIVLITILKLLSLIGQPFSAPQLLIAGLLGLILPSITISLLRSYRASDYIIAFVLISPNVDTFRGLGEMYSSKDLWIIVPGTFYVLLILAITILPIYLFIKIHPNYFKKSV